jgi:hypothetical protein
VSLQLWLKREAAYMWLVDVIYRVNGWANHLADGVSAPEDVNLPAGWEDFLARIDAYGSDDATIAFRTWAEAYTALSRLQQNRQGWQGPTFVGARAVLLTAHDKLRDVLRGELQNPPGVTGS